jgi:dsDNA-specific endonuclease/ATPase MutS2
VKKEEVAAPVNTMEKTTLGDIQSLADLKDQMVEAAAKSAAKAAKKAKAEAPAAEAAPAAEETPEA